MQAAALVPIIVGIQSDDGSVNQLVGDAEGKHADGREQKQQPVAGKGLRARQLQHQHHRRRKQCQGQHPLVEEARGR